ncbi:unnamed protein product [Dibothriocephalus latus]|uniref:Uncharacterized protein n=1 Tax=Dibothriocephalus latus TaxID=60516 RepID=A0A3P7LUF6_DIBLA|nr:unnamed protein product [Dibothriocephalus latus]
MPATVNKVLSELIFTPLVASEDDLSDGYSHENSGEAWFTAAQSMPHLCYRKPSFMASSLLASATSVSKIHLKQASTYPALLRHRTLSSNSMSLTSNSLQPSDSKGLQVTTAPSKSLRQFRITRWMGSPFDPINAAVHFGKYILSNQGCA